MSTLLSCQSLTVSNYAKNLFDSISFTLQKGDRVGLIGHNGCGKSTLLKVLSGQWDDFTGQVTLANRCVMAYVEQQMPNTLYQSTLLQAVAERVRDDEVWRAELLLTEMGLPDQFWDLKVAHLSGGQHMRLLLARALIQSPDLLLLDEPSNHLDLPSLLWLEGFLKSWKGSFVLVSHDKRLLDNVTNTSWIMRDAHLHHFSMPCSEARAALTERDESDRLRHVAEQKEIDRIEASAKRLAEWGKVYDNEDLARKAKTMQARKERLEEEQTQLTQGTPWKLKLSGNALPADRLLHIEHLLVRPSMQGPTLFKAEEKRIKSGDRIAVLGSNGSGKSSLLNVLKPLFDSESSMDGVKCHPKCELGYYDQSQNELDDEQTLSDALIKFASISQEERKMALISAGFAYSRHSDKVASLSGGERARLLFVGLTLANYHLVFLDEPTNHLDMEGKEDLIDTLKAFDGGALVVSHDRELIELSCNRFWLIEDGELVEYLSAQDAYQAVSEVAPKVEEGGVMPSQSKSPRECNEETLLEQLVQLETLLEQDKGRKAKHQKPALQKKWQEEIDAIQALL